MLSSRVVDGVIFRINKLGNADEGITLVAKDFKYLRKRLEGVFLPAVKKDYAPFPNVGSNAVYHFLRGKILPVAAVNVPLNSNEAELLRRFNKLV